MTFTQFYEACMGAHRDVRRTEDTIGEEAAKRVSLEHYLFIRNRIDVEILRLAGTSADALLKPLTVEQIASIESLCSECTPSPWHLQQDYFQDHDTAVMGMIEYDIIRNTTTETVRVGGTDPSRVWADARLIEQSRELVPMLLGEVKRLNAMLEIVSGTTKESG